MHSDLSITQNRNKRMIIAIMGLVMGMVGLAYASVPLYQLFCQVTGYGGTPMINKSKVLSSMFC